MNETRPIAAAEAHARALEEDIAYITAADAPLHRRSRVLKHDDTFAVFDDGGDFNRFSNGVDGLFFRDTRFLSRLILSLGRQVLMPLSSTISDDNLSLSVDQTNPDMFEDGRLILPRESVHILRTAFLTQGALHMTIELHNFGAVEARLPLTVYVRSDFADIFEARGQKRARRGEILPPEANGDGIVLRYRGLDAVLRETRIRFEPAPDVASGASARWNLVLPPNDCLCLRLSVSCALDGVAPPPEDFDDALRGARRARRERAGRAADIFTSNESFNDWLSHSRADLTMLTTATTHGFYPYAGTPWFSTAFGRDGILTAMQCLWFDPWLARGTLSYLAATQAAALDPSIDAEPGKILHETRSGEMSALGEVPFALYYGTIDATPLFVMLAHAYFRRTGEIGFIREIWPNVQAALRWMDDYGDSDGDGFLEYARHSPNGLTNQGWKDSADSVFHDDGRLADAPIALCEVQAYAYAARRGAAELARRLGDEATAAQEEAKAEALRAAFEEAFWMEDLGTYAIALDGAKRPCRVRSSNAGHVLFGGLASPERAARVADTLMLPTSFSDWGIRTLASTEANYNPMSYHNGSIWPHDNAIIGMGFARYGLNQPLATLLAGMFDASSFMPMRRLPELFCGFPRRHAEGPTAYPVACAPQAWSSATVFGLLGACLGVDFDPDEGKARFDRPNLPPFLKDVTIRDLTAGERSVSLMLRRRDGAATIEGAAELFWM